MTDSARPELKDMPEFISVDELADAIGLGRDVIYREAKAGKLPGVRQVGRFWRCHRDTVLAWFRGNGALGGDDERTP